MVYKVRKQKRIQLLVTVIHWIYYTSGRKTVKNELFLGCQACYSKVVLCDQKYELR